MKRQTKIYILLVILAFILVFFYARSYINKETSLKKQEQAYQELTDGNDDKAEKLLEEAIQLNKKNKQAYYDLAGLYCKHKDNVKIVETLKEAEKHFQLDYVIYHFLAVALENTQKRDEALSYYKKALSNTPDSDMIYKIMSLYPIEPDKAFDAVNDLPEDSMFLELIKENTLPAYINHTNSLCV